MGRYSSVKAYADNNDNMRSIPYAQAAGSVEPKEGAGKFRFYVLLLVFSRSALLPADNLPAVKAEKVVNPYGSTAGAGSGEFHIYRHARAREAERWKQLNDAEQEKAMEEEYQRTLEHYQTEEERKTAQRRKKRQRQKEAKQNKKNLALSGVNLGEEKQPEVADDEFTYIPVAVKPDEDDDEGKKKPNGKLKSLEVPAKLPLANDDSFLRKWKAQIAESNERPTLDDNTDDERPMKKVATGTKGD